MPLAVSEVTFILRVTLPANSANITVSAVNKLTPEEVRAEVTKYWNALNSKALDRFEEFYAAEATVFGSMTSRTEPGRLVVARRRREYFHPRTKLQARTGKIDVFMLGDQVAIASYSFEFHALQIMLPSGKYVDEHLIHGRATQVLARDTDGAIRVFHEHLSAPAPMPAAIPEPGSDEKDQPKVDKTAQAPLAVGCRY